MRVIAYLVQRDTGLKAFGFAEKSFVVKGGMTIMNFIGNCCSREF